jgi:hypothetical protein
MAIMQPKDFIRTVFMSETGQIVNNHPYISSMIIGIGIEFLGKCIDTGEQDWNKQGNSKKHFNLAINRLDSLAQYRPYLDTHDLYISFRCGLVHAAFPNYLITLSSKNEAPNLILSRNRLNLKIEDLYQDFYNACNEVINMTFTNTDKMNLPFLQVPVICYGANDISASGTTKVPRV